MSYKHITINELTNIEANYRLCIKARECAVRMKIGKDKVYTYYKLFRQGFTVIEIYDQYRINKKNCGRKPIMLSDEKLKEIDKKLNSDWSLDTIAGRDKIDQAPGKVFY